MIIHLITWAFLIASWTLPRNWFNETTKWRATKTALAGIGTGIALAGLISICLQ